MNYFEEYTTGVLPAVEPLPDRWFEERDKESLGNTEFSDLLGPAVRTTAGSRLMSLIAEKIYQPEADNRYELKENTIKDVTQKYNKDSSDYILDAKSDKDLQYRKSIEDDKLEDMAKLSRGGLTGTALVLGANILDPVSLSAGLASGGSSWVANATGLSKVARAALVAGVENAAIEGVIAMNDHHYKWQDFVLNVGVGSLLGGAMHLPSGIRSMREQAEDVLLDAASDLKADSVVRNNSEKLQPAYAKKNPAVDTESINNRIFEKTREYRDLAKQEVPKSRIKLEEKKLKALEKEYNSNYAYFKDVQKGMEAKRNSLRDQKAEYVEKFNSKRKDIDSKYSKLIDEAKVKIAKAEKVLAKATGNKVQKANAKYWKAGNDLEIIYQRKKIEVNSMDNRLKRGIERAERKLKAEFEEATTQLRKDQDLIRNQIDTKRYWIRKAKSAKGARGNLNTWNRMTMDEKIKHIYGDEVPVKQRTPREITDTWTPPSEQAGYSAGAAASVDFPNAFQIKFDDQAKFNNWGEIGEKLPSSFRFMETKAGRAVGSMANKLSTSKSMAMRGFQSKVLENPQGGKRGYTIDLYTSIEERNMRSAGAGVVEPAFEGWMKANKNNIKDIVFNPDFRDNFNKKTFLAITDPDSASDEFVREAAEAYANIFETALGRMQKYGVKAFEGIESKRTYVPKIMSNMKLKQKLAFNKGLVRDVLVKGYMEGDYRLPRKAAEAIADAHIMRASDSALTFMEGVNRVSSVNSTNLAQLLSDAGVPSDVIESLETARLASEGEMMMQNRARMSLGINPNSEVGGLSVVDLLETNLPSIVDRYVKDSAYDTALARMGYATRAELEKDIQLLNEGMINSMVHTGQTTTEIAHEIQILRDSLGRISGKSIDKVAGTTLGKTIRRVKGYAGLLRLNQLGFSTFAEPARMIVDRPMSIMKEAIPAMKVFGTDSQRVGGVLKRKDWMEMDRVLQWAGEDHKLYGQGLRTEVLEEGLEDSRVGKIIDNALSYGKHAQSVASGFRLVQGSAERLSVRSLGDKIAQSAISGKNLFDQPTIDYAGWSNKFLDDVYEHVRTKGGIERTDSGTVVRTLGIDDMPNEMFDNFQAGIHRIASREMQRLYVGETPRYMHTTLGSLLTQFRAFSIGSLEKQLLYDLKYNRSKGLLIFLTSMFLSGISYGSRVMLNSIGREDQYEYIENRMSGMNLTWGVFGGMGQIAAVEPALDIAATLGMLPDTLMSSPGKRGATPLGARSVPAFGVIGDTTRLIRDVSKQLTTDDDVNLIKDIRNLTIYNNMIGINQLLNYIE
jgi:hypothetical protein